MDYATTFHGRYVGTVKLNSGLELALHLDRRLPLVAVHLSSRVGARDDPEGCRGLAHLVEHVLSGQDSAALERLGGIRNGATSWDYTSFFTTLPSSRLELALELEGKRLRAASRGARAADLDRERRVVVNERAQRVDSQPYGRAYETAAGMLYPEKHPYSLPIIGFPKDIERIDLATLHAFCRQRYTPSGSLLTVVGEFEPDRVLRLAEQYLGGLHPGQPPRTVEREPPGRAREAFRQVRERVPASRLLLGFQTPAFGDRLWYVGEVLAHLLASGPTSRLEKTLVHDRRLAVDCRVRNPPTELLGSFWIDATAVPGRSARLLLEAIEEQLEAVAEGRVEDGELQCAIGWARNSYYTEVQRLALRAERIARSRRVFGDTESWLEEPDLLSGVTPAELQSFVRSFVTVQWGATLIVEPEL